MKVSYAQTRHFGACFLYSQDELDEEEFVLPFRTLIENNDPATLMTAHVLFPAIDTKPATLSTFFLTEYLRDELGYTGIVITDDLIMNAITASYTPASAAVAVLAAGAYVVLFAAEPEAVNTAIEAVLTAVEEGDLSETRIDESYERVLKAKKALA